MPKPRDATGLGSEPSMRMIFPRAPTVACCYAGGRGRRYPLSCALRPATSAFLLVVSFTPWACPRSGLDMCADKEENRKNRETKKRNTKQKPSTKEGSTDNTDSWREPRTKEAPLVRGSADRKQPKAQSSRQPPGDKDTRPELKLTAGTRNRLEACTTGPLQVPPRCCGSAHTAGL